MLTLNSTNEALKEMHNEVCKCTATEFSTASENGSVNNTNVVISNTANWKIKQSDVCTPMSNINFIKERKKANTDDKITVHKEVKQCLFKLSGAEASSSDSKRSTSKSQHKKGKDSFRKFLARSKKQAKEMDSKEDITEEYVKDDYAKAASCQHLVQKRTGIIYDDEMTLHECPWDPNYPENPNRYRVVLERCLHLGLIQRCFELPYVRANMDQITKLHTERLYKKLQLISTKTSIQEQERDALDYDAIYFNKETFNAALLSAGCAISLVQAICEGTVQNGMAIIRPPGHHAMNDEYCGYCYFNNVAVAAQHALDNNLANKILIVDFDVHHGQGTQRLFYNDKRVLYFSIHRYEHGKFWPNLRESNYDYIGEGDGVGYNINFPLNVTGLEDKDYLSIVHQILLPVAYEFQPDLIIFSAGFDSVLGDEKGEMKITPGFYGHLVTLLSGLACGKLAACLEGGYFLPSLAEGAAMTLKSLIGDSPATLLPLTMPDCTVIETINNLKIILRDYWNCFGVYPIYTELDSDSDLHKAVIHYEGKPEKAPFLTRDCYPPQSKQHTEKYSKIITELQNEYGRLGTNQSVSCCYDEDMLLHKSSKHVETPNRLQETYSLYQQWGLNSRCINLKPKIVDPAVVRRVHKEVYVNKILEKDFGNLIQKNIGDMFFNEDTLRAIMKAAGCLLAVVDSVMKNESKSGVALIRPPGHHASSDKPSGFCYVNNVAVAAQYILDTYQLEKILIIDFDIHHGNGTQNIFYDENKVLYLSIHRYENGKYFPYSTEGNIDCCGKDSGEGFNVNVAMSKDRLSNIDYITIYHRIVLPIAYSYAPEVILVSAGFDAGINDNLGNYFVTPDCFGHFIQMLKSLANGKLILALEGGYNPTTVKYSMNICIKTLLGDPLPLLDLVPNRITDNCFKTVDNVMKIQKKYWPAVHIDKKLSAGSKVFTVKSNKKTEQSGVEIQRQTELPQQMQQVNIS